MKINSTSFGNAYIVRADDNKTKKMLKERNGSEYSVHPIMGYLCDDLVLTGEDAVVTEKLSNSSCLNTLLQEYKNKAIKLCNMD